MQYAGNLLCHELIDRSVRVYLQLPCPKYLQSRPCVTCLLLAFLWQPWCDLCLGAWAEAAAFLAQRKGSPAWSTVLHHHCYIVVPDDASHDAVVAVEGEKRIWTETSVWKYGWCWLSFLTFLERLRKLQMQQEFINEKSRCWSLQKSGFQHQLT